MILRAHFPDNDQQKNPHPNHDEGKKTLKEHHDRKGQLKVRSKSMGRGQEGCEGGRRH